MPLNPSSFITALPIDDFSVKVVNDIEKDYAALKLFPPLMVGKKTGLWYQYDNSHLIMDSVDAPAGTEAPSGSYGAFTSTYTCKDKAFKGLVLEKNARDFDRPVADLDRDMAAMNMTKLMNALEDAVHTKATTTSNYTSTQVLSLSAGDTWADASSDPIDDVRNMCQAVADACGKYPNTMTLSKKGLNYLRIHPAIRELTKYTMAGSVPVELIANLLDLDFIWASKAVKNTAPEGATEVLSSIWEDDAVLAYVDPNPGLTSMCYGRTVMVNQLYTKTLDAPERGRGLGAHWIESGWELTPEFMAQVSTSNADALAGAVIANIF
jgi:hypothetical protein